MITDLSASQLRRAADIKDKIESFQGELNQLLGGSNKEAPAPRKRHKMSAAGRASIAAAVRARWAKAKGAKKSVKPAQKPKRKMSAAGRARISAAAKARWKQAKAQGKKSLKGL